MSLMYVNVHCKYCVIYTKKNIVYIAEIINFMKFISEWMNEWWLQIIVEVVELRQTDKNQVWSYFHWKKTFSNKFATNFGKFTPLFS